MPDDPINFTNRVKDADVNAAFARGAAERDGRRRTRVAADLDVAGMLPLYVSAGPRRVVLRSRSSQHDAANPTTN